METIPHESVCAVVVTYNRKKLLLSCLDALLAQTKPLAAICLLDNHSSDGTKEFLISEGFLPDASPDIQDQNKSLLPLESCETYTLAKQNRDSLKIHYVRTMENSGGAGGFHYGVRFVYERGYDWLWLMDDDGQPDPQALHYLIQNKKHGDVLASLVLDKDNDQKLCFGLRIHGKSYYLRSEAERLASNGVLKIDTGNFFNSVLIPQEVVANIGVPDKDFFIWGDEMDYLYRILKHRYTVTTITPSIHRHPSPGTSYVGWKQYYMARNMVVLIRRYKTARYILIPLKSLAKVILISLWRRKNIGLILRGLWDGLWNRMGKTVNPG